MELNYEVINPEKKERLVFLNPLTSNYTVWKTIAHLFKEHYEILLMDYPGYGLSEYSEIQTVEELSLSIVDTVKDLDEKPTHLIGYSFGSWIAQNLVVSGELNIKSLCLIGSSAHVYQLGIFMAEGWLEILETSGLDAMLKQLAYWSFHPLTFQKQPEILNLYVRNSKKGITNIDGLKNQIKAIANYREGVDLFKIDIPTLIIRGDYDVSYPRFCSTKLVSGITNSEYLEIPNSAHATLWEQPKEVVIAVMDFLKKVNLNERIDDEGDRYGKSIDN